jgi:hypothetical protein
MTSSKVTAAPLMTTHVIYGQPIDPLFFSIAGVTIDVICD